MKRRVSAQELLLISKSNKATLDRFKHGVQLENLTGYRIDELKEKACRDRLNLASSHLKSANRAFKETPQDCRLTLGRAYYAMYHSVRALVFAIHGGDDHEEHSKLPTRIPGDFQDRDHWENELKNARLERNKADYDPYPKKDSAFKASAELTLGKAQILLPLVRVYLRSKGHRV